MLDHTTKEPVNIWLNAHAFGENILNHGRAMGWDNPIEFSENYKRLQGIVGADRLSLPLMGFLDYWIASNRYVLNEMSGKKRVRFAIKKLLTHEALRTELNELVASCCAMAGCELILELPSNSALVAWAHKLANPGEEVQDLSDLDIDSTSVYLADTVRTLKNTGIAGVAATLSAADLANGGAVELYQPLINVAANYRWQFAFRKPVNSGTQHFASEEYYCLGADDCSQREELLSLDESFWQGNDALNAACSSKEWVYAELPAFVEPELVRQRLALIREATRG